MCSEMNVNLLKKFVFENESEDKDTCAKENKVNYPITYAKENGRFPIINVMKNQDGDTVITTGDGRGNFVNYTFSE